MHCFIFSKFGIFLLTSTLNDFNILCPGKQKMYSQPVLSSHPRVMEGFIVSTESGYYVK